MILLFKNAWAASSIISQLSFDSAMFSLSCLIPVPPVLGVPLRSMILSALFLAPRPSFIVATSSLTTSNSPLKRVSFAGFIVYLSVFKRAALTPGTVSTRPSKDAEIWNSLKRQAITHPVVALDKPTWSLTITGVLMAVPMRVYDDVKVSFQGSCRVADGNSPVNKTRELFFESFNHLTETFEFLDFNFEFLLIDVNSLQFATIVI